MKADEDEQHRAEADRLALIPVADQQDVLAIYQQCADNPKIPKRERAWGQARVAALQRHLRRLNRAKAHPEK